MSVLMPPGRQAFFDSAGAPLVGGRVYTYDSGTNTPRPTYTTAAGITANTNPTILDARGEGVFFWSGAYKVVLTDADGVTLWTVDGVVSSDTLPNTLDAALRADLATSNNIAKGSGMVAFGAGISYGTGSIGYRVNKAAHPSNTNVLLAPGNANDASLTGTIGYRNTAVGVGAAAAVGSATVAGGSNAWFGYGTGFANTDGSGNSAFGAQALTANITGDHNNAFGYQVLQAHASGAQNNAFGFRAMYSLTAGNNNSGFGESSMYTLTNGNGNVAMGMLSLYSKTTGDFTTSVGYQSGFGETTASGGVYLGYRAGFTVTTAAGNTLVGWDCGNGVATGQYNTGVGFEVFKAINASGAGLGEFNVGMGYWALRRMTTGSSNTAMGQQAGSFVTTGAQNVCIGDSSGAGVTTSSGNVCVGSATSQNLNGANNTCVGFNAGALGAPQTYTNTTNVGNGAVPTASNQINLGNASVTQIRAQVTVITALSDRRDKADIKPLTLGLDFINLIDPVEFTWKTREGSARDGEREAGFIAQELKAAQEQAGAEWLGLVLEANPDRIEATPGKLLPILVKAVQELSAQNASLAAQLAALKAA